VRRALAWALLTALALLLAPVASLAGDDSPWPERGGPRAQVRAIRTVLRRLEREVSLMQLSAARYGRWEACLRGVPVSEYGDEDRRYGFRYDERDGTGPGHMPALAVDRLSRPGHEDYLMFDFSGRNDCRSAPPLPGGTADAASAGPSAGAAAVRSVPRASSGTLLDRYGRRVERLERAVRHLEAAAERFDAWESCVSWVPVTEYGDPDGGFGYRFARGGAAPVFRPAIAIDRSDWDDPDYMLLALVGGDRPGGTCQDEPGEGVD
jgi:hypothetical protein